MMGVQIVSVGEPLRKLPDEVAGKHIALKMTGGVGDCLMSIGSSAKLLSELGATCTAVVRPHQISLISELVGVSRCIATVAFNDPQVWSNFDAIIDFKGTFNRARELVDQDYYEAVGFRLGRSVEVGQFRFGGPVRMSDLVALHPGASNPNRRWLDDRWKELAYELRSRGLRVVWFGTKDEYGFNDDGIDKLSDETSDLREQAQTLDCARMFVGCDSGFAHVAGILGVRGVVLFANTDAKNVIVRYPKLVGVRALGAPATRSLNPDCEQSLVGMCRIYVDMVLSALKLEDAIKETVREIPRPPAKFKVRVHGNALSDLKIALESRCDVRYSEPPIDWTPDAVLLVTNETCCMEVGDRKVFVRSDGESVVRALRELIK